MIFSSSILKPEHMAAPCISASIQKAMRLIPVMMFLWLNLSAQNTHLEVVKDTVKVINAELVIQNSTKTQKGVLFNEGNGKTLFHPLRLVKIGDSSIALSGIDTVNIANAFKLLQGKTVQFRAGLSSGYPIAGDSVYVNTDFIGRSIKLWRNGLMQEQDQVQGFVADSATGKVTFRPRLLHGDKIFIEATGGIDVVIAENNVFSTNLTKLNAGAIDNLNNTFTIRWATNDRTLTNSPRVFGMGSSTLFGYLMSYPDRLGDRIQLWLNDYTTNPTWMNVAVTGYTSQNVQSVSNGGIDGHNIDTALKANPDFIYLVLASNDPANGLTVQESMANYRRLDSIAFSRGIPLFMNTTQPRTGFSSTLQTQLKVTADSIRAAFPDRYVEAFKIVADTLAATDAVIRHEYDIGDNTHLNPEGIKLVANSLFKRLQQYFQPIYGVSQYVVEASSDKTSWFAFDVISDQNIVKKTYSRSSTTAYRYFRVKAVYENGTSSTFSNVAALSPAGGNPPSSFFDHRVLVDLGGDGVTTTNGSGVVDGLITYSPDSSGNYWNNWTGLGGNSGFDNGTQLRDLVTTTNKATAMSVRFYGNPLGTQSANGAYAMNFNGINQSVGDYPKSAVYDNMYFHESINNITTADNPDGGVTLRVKGLIPNNIYYIKLWGARVDPGGVTRTLQAKLGHEPWSGARTYDAKYSNHTGDYNRAITFTGITGSDSVNINIKVSNGSFGHIALMDIGILGQIPLAPSVSVRDTSVVLPDSSVNIVPTIILNSGTISSYAWTQISGPSTATFSNPTSPVTTINNLTNGIFNFRLTCNTSLGIQVKADLKVSVFPPSTGGKVLRINFSKAPAPPIPGWFNLAGSPHDNVVNVTEPVTGWTINTISKSGGYWTPFSNLTSNDNVGKITGDNRGIVPDIALKNFWFNFTSNTASTTGNMIISGLDPGKTYTLEFVASRSSTDGSLRYGVYKVNGGSMLTVNAYNNTSNNVSTTATPDSGGNIYLEIYAPPTAGTYGSYSYLNALIVKEN